MKNYLKKYKATWAKIEDLDALPVYDKRHIKNQNKNIRQ